MSRLSQARYSEPRREKDTPSLCLQASLDAPVPYFAHNAFVKERIQKILANAGVASRRNIEEMVRQGRVKINGKVKTDLPILIDPEKDRVVVDDELIGMKPGKDLHRYYWLLNKPKGVYSTNVAQGAQLRAIDLLPPGFQGPGLSGGPVGC